MADEDDRRPESSPFESPSIEVYFGDGLKLNIPSSLILNCPSLRPMGKWPPRSITLDSVNSGVGHVMFYYLLTDTYQCLRPQGSTQHEKLVNELTTSVGVYNASRKYDLLPLQEIATDEIRRLAEELPFPLVLNLLRSLDLNPSARETWLDDYVQSGLKSLFRTPTAFLDLTTLQVDNDVISFSNIILKSLANLLANDAVSIRNGDVAEPAPALEEIEAQLVPVLELISEEEVLLEAPPEPELVTEPEIMPEIIPEWIPEAEAAMEPEPSAPQEEPILEPEPEPKPKPEVADPGLEDIVKDDAPSSDAWSFWGKKTEKTDLWNDPPPPPDVDYPTPEPEPLPVAVAEPEPIAEPAPAPAPAPAPDFGFGSEAEPASTPEVPSPAPSTKKPSDKKKKKRLSIFWAEEETPEPKTESDSQSIVPEPKKEPEPAPQPKASPALSPAPTPVEAPAPAAAPSKKKKKKKGIFRTEDDATPPTRERSATSFWSVRDP